MLDTSDSCVVAEGVTLHYRVHGSGGPWHTFLHGGLLGSATWRDQVEHLTDVGRLLTFDQRGYGASTRPDTPHGIEDLARDMFALWDALGIDGSVVVGFSLGGLVALEAALAWPERVRGLVLVGATAAPEDAARTAFRSRAEHFLTAGVDAERDGLASRAFSARFLQEHPDRVRDYCAAVNRNDAGSVAFTFDAIAAFDRAADASQVRCPTLVIHGSDDASIPVESGIDLATSIRGSRLVLVPECGHTVHAERPAAFESALRSFLLEEITTTA